MTRDEARAAIGSFARRNNVPELDAAATMLAVAVTTLQVARVTITDPGDDVEVEGEPGPDDDARRH